MAKILYGAPVREEIKNKLIEKIKKLEKRPVLAIVQVGDRPDSNIYIKNKVKFGEEIGVQVVLKKFEHDTNTQMNPNGTNEARIIQEIKKLAEDKNTDGIIVQLPLPESIDSEKILNLIPKQKDADGLVPLPFGEGAGGGVLITPATARAVMAILDFYKIEVEGKNVAVIDRSKLTDGPIAEVLKKKGARVDVCHKETTNTAEVCRNADILVSAAGQIDLVGKDFINPNQVIIDVGINKRENGKLCGDVNFQEVEPLVKAISPVPGGVGLVTVACLFINLLILLRIKN